MGFLDTSYRSSILTAHTPSSESICMLAASTFWRARCTGEDPPPGLFQQSLGILDAEGKRIRFEYDTDGHRTRVDVSYEWVGVEDPVTGEPQAP